MEADKIEIQKQWNNDPCGAVTVKSIESGTLEFYRAIRNFRYNNYGPWFDSVMLFDNYKNLSVLEVGVGLGSDHYRFARNANKMTALDLSKNHLEHTIKHLELEGFSTQANLGDAENMPFNENTFDVVYSFGVLHHTPNTEKSISEVLRVLKPGGTAIIGLYHRDSFFFWFMTVFWNGFLKAGLIRKGWRRLLSEIEYRENKESAIPLVKVYSRSDVMKLFKNFSNVKLQVCHVEADHFGKFSKIVEKLNRTKIERFFGFYGWYIIATAEKRN